MANQPTKQIKHNKGIPVNKNLAAHNQNVKPQGTQAANPLAGANKTPNNATKNTKSVGTGKQGK